MAVNELLGEEELVLMVMMLILKSLGGDSVDYDGDIFFWTSKRVTQG